MNDRDLGMDRRITRRDFLDGVAMTAGMLAIPGCMAHVAAPPIGPDPEKSPGYYPPALTGMRGNYDGTYSYAHALRDKTFWNAGRTAASTGERYDLVVVGGGISGLSAAY